MTIRFSAPSKTFLVGEYAVLCGGPALIVNTLPRFTLVAREGGAGSDSPGFPAESPAGKWLSANPVKGMGLEFDDPHSSRGGLGASSAQFLLSYALSAKLAGRQWDSQTLWSDYKKFSGAQASGADVLAQHCGEVALVDMHAHQAEAKTWPYADLDFAILRTGKKVQTHLHLADLDLEPLAQLIGPAHAAVESFGNAPAETFLKAVKTYAFLLRDLNLQAPSTLLLLKLLEDQPWCKVAKGCGALGADTVIVFFSGADAEVARKFMTEKNLDVVATCSNLSHGLKSEGEHEG